MLRTVRADRRLITIVIVMATMSDYNSYSNGYNVLSYSNGYNV